MIKLYGSITDPAGKPVPGALIELRSLTTTSEVLMGSELTFKCDANGCYSFDLATGTYDVYAQNDLCHDMDYMGTGVVTAQSVDGPLNSILIDSGISLTPPLIERAVQAMQQAENAAASASKAQVQTAESALSVDHASKLASDQAGIASREATKAEGKAGEAAQSAKVAADAERLAQQWAEESVDVVVTGKKFSARHHAVKAGEFAANAGVSASESAASATIAAGKAESTAQSAALAAAKANEATISAKMSSNSADAAGKASAAAANSETSAKRHSAKAEEAAQASESAKISTLDHAKQVAQQAQQVTGDRKRVEGLAKEIDEHSVTVSSLAQEVSTNTAAARQAKTEVQSMRDTTLTKAAQAIAAADTASDKASLAAQDQAAANLSAQHASLAERMAEAWAQNPEGSDINGRPGEFSALHWALQAQKWAQAITSQLVWAGPWNAAAGAPVAPANNQGIPFYRVSHPGVIADVSFGVGDYLHWDPATKAWFKIDGTDAVISVNGMTGAVVLSAADVGARPSSWVPQWDEVTNKPVTMPPSEHAHSWSQLTGIPVFALRWPTLKEVGAAAESHTHQWSQLVGVPTYATRWPSWSEVTNKPALAAANHTHPYMADGGSYGTIYLGNWFRSTGDSGWYNETYGGGFYMIDTTWVRIYNNKKIHVSNTDANAIDTAGGVYAAGNGNFADVYIRSDKRLKSEFTPIISALDKLKRLTGWIYTKNGQREAGLIAQEVAEVQPESVYLNEDGYLSLAGAGVIALVIEAMKELDAKLGARNGGTK
ncbi:prophage tail fiber N-terminal domain-containing protein [Aeromonas jandaei]|uniref:prophage tail fiber N-terminal domain-containing protein n=1 Tax=Aeromonas jandaei TaxID=650 RepID=UPI003EC721AB